MGGFHDLFSMRPPSLLVLLGWSTVSCVLCLLFDLIYLVVYLQFNLLISNLYFSVFCIFYFIYICILPHFQPPSQNTKALPPLTPTGSPPCQSICFVHLPYLYNTLFYMWLFLGPLHPEDGGSMILQNVRNYSQ